MKIDICQVCRGNLFFNKQFQSEHFMTRYLALLGYYEIFLPKIKIMEQGMNGCKAVGKVDVCPDCFNEIVDAVRKKRSEG